MHLLEILLIINFLWCGNNYDNISHSRSNCKKCAITPRDENGNKLIPYEKLKMRYHKSPFGLKTKTKDYDDHGKHNFKKKSRKHKKSKKNRHKKRHNRHKRRVGTGSKKYHTEEKDDD